jgi:hypothetical protein
MRWVAAAGGAAGSDACADALLRIQAGMLRSQTAIGAFLAFESAFVAAKPPRLFQLQALLGPPHCLTCTAHCTYHRQVNSSLNTEREFAKKLGEQATATQGELKAALQSASDLGAQTVALSADLKAR